MHFSCIFIRKIPNSCPSRKSRRVGPSSARSKKSSGLRARPLSAGAVSSTTMYSPLPSPTAWGLWLTFISRTVESRAAGVLGGGLTASRGAARSLGLPPPRPFCLDYSTGCMLCQEFFRGGGEISPLALSGVLWWLPHRIISHTARRLDFGERTPAGCKDADHSGLASQNSLPVHREALRWLCPPFLYRG